MRAKVAAVVFNSKNFIMKNVKRTFFEDGYLAPCYELEDGTILLPFIKAGLLTWATREEGDKIKTKAADKWCHFFSKKA